MKFVEEHDSKIGNVSHHFLQAKGTRNMFKVAVAKNLNLNVQTWNATRTSPDTSLDIKMGSNLQAICKIDKYIRKYNQESWLLTIEWNTDSCNLKARPFSKWRRWESQPHFVFLRDQIGWQTVPTPSKERVTEVGAIVTVTSSKEAWSILWPELGEIQANLKPRCGSDAPSLLKFPSNVFRRKSGCYMDFLINTDG